MNHHIPNRISTVHHHFSFHDSNELREKYGFENIAAVIALCLFLITVLSSVLSFFLE
ncbi:MAG TPA: hypothetical protein VJB60_02395 [Candidatus Peribacterales bacterium]|nr:hypothetical protein [Candidatus Peribacterales bacterium]